MNATVNSNCIGCGLCSRACPRKLITVDGKVLPPLQARESCPVNAIDLE